MLAEKLGAIRDRVVVRRRNPIADTINDPESHESARRGDGAEGMQRSTALRDDGHVKTVEESAEQSAASRPSSTPAHFSRGWRGSLRKMVTAEFREHGAKVFAEPPIDLRDAQRRELAVKLRALATLAEECSGRARSIREFEIAEDMSGIRAWTEEHARAMGEKGGAYG